MLTKKELIEALDGFPDDAVVVANDGASFIALGKPVLVRKYEDHIEVIGRRTIVSDHWFGSNGEDYGEVDDDLCDGDVCAQSVLIVCDGPR